MVMAKAEKKKDYDFFISYSARDSDAAKTLMKHLPKYFEQTDTNIFIDDVDIKPGENWREKIETAVRSCDTFVILISNAARNSEECSTEWSAICERKWTEPNVRVIPILVDEAEIPAFLKNLRTLDGRDASKLLDCASQIADYPAVAMDPVKFDSLPKEAREQLQQRLRALLKALPDQQHRPSDSSPKTDQS
jgi:hypothetical protein